MRLEVIGNVTHYRYRRTSETCSFFGFLRVLFQPVSYLDQPRRVDIPANLQLHYNGDRINSLHSCSICPPGPSSLAGQVDGGEGSTEADIPEHNTETEADVPEHKTETEADIPEHITETEADIPAVTVTVTQPP